MSLPLVVLMGVVLLDDLYVDAASTNCGTADGSEAAPFCTVTGAVDAALDGDVIYIAPGTYVENVVVDRDVALIGLQGAQVTTMDGGGLDRVMVVPEDHEVLVDGLTITGGQATYGGGVLVEGALTISNSTISGNTASGGTGQLWGGGGVFGGGGIHVVNGDLSVLRCTVEQNQSDLNGGGIRAYNSDARVSESSIRNNLGGGFYGTRGFHSIGSSTFSGNTGAGCASWYGDFLLSESTLTQNETGVVCKGGIQYWMSISGSTITNNSLSGIYCSYYDSYTLLEYPVRVSRSVVSGNGQNADVWGVTPLNTFIGGMPALGPLQDNGGPTETQVPVTGSPLIDALSTGGGSDQRGFERDSAADIGAVEFQGMDRNLCNGDGGPSPGCTPCPCSNDAPPGTIGGCLNTAGISGRIRAYGSPHLVPAWPLSPLRIEAEGLSPSTFAVLVSGTAIPPQNPANPCFGLDTGLAVPSLNGLRCTAGMFRRHGTRSVSPSGSVGLTTDGWGGGDPLVPGLVSQAGFVAGEKVYFQVYYREPAGQLCNTGTNTTQAIEVTVLP